MLPKSENDTFLKLGSTIGVDIYAKPCGTWSDYSEAEFWLASVKLQISEKQLC